eukprot:306006-Amorphochlora_amoeboformis.AAC.1
MRALAKRSRILQRWPPHLLVSSLRRVKSTLVVEPSQSSCEIAGPGSFHEQKNSPQDALRLEAATKYTRSLTPDSKSSKDGVEISILEEMGQLPPKGADLSSVFRSVPEKSRARLYSSLIFRLDSKRNYASAHRWLLNMENDLDLKDYASVVDTAARIGELEVATRCLQKMRASGLEAGHELLSVIVIAYLRNRELSKAEEEASIMVSGGHPPSPAIFSSLIASKCKVDRPEEAEKWLK